MEAVLLDPVVSGLVAAARPFAAEAPAHRVDRDVELASGGGIGQAIGGRERAHPASQDDDFLPLVAQACHSTRPGSSVMSITMRTPRPVSPGGARPSAAATGVFWSVSSVIA